MPFFMLRKRDGTGLYATKDLALARLKFEEYGIDRSIYVVDVRQSDHFKHVFLTLKKMGFTQAERCQHVPYEMVELPDGPMATRKGNVILFRSLREQMVAHIRREYLDKFSPEWPEQEIRAPPTPSPSARSSTACSPAT
jgi:arginyl-tRNA synthetase